MFEGILALALENGIWTALFCLLFIYQLRDSREREKKYTLTIHSLTHSIKIVDLIKADTSIIKKDSTEIKKDIKQVENLVKGSKV